MNFSGTVGDEPKKNDFRKNTNKRNNIRLIGNGNTVDQVKRACDKLDKEVSDGYQQDQSE